MGFKPYLNVETGMGPGAKRSKVYKGEITW